MVAVLGFVDDTENDPTGDGTSVLGGLMLGIIEVGGGGGGGGNDGAGDILAEVATDETFGTKDDGRQSWRHPRSLATRLNRTSSTEIVDDGVGLVGAT